MILHTIPGVGLGISVVLLGIAFFHRRTTWLTVYGWAMACLAWLFANRYWG